MGVIFFFLVTLNFRDGKHFIRYLVTGLLFLKKKKTLRETNGEAEKKPVNQAAQVLFLDLPCLRKSVTCVSRAIFFLSEKPGIVRKGRYTSPLCLDHVCASPRSLRGIAARQWDVVR